MPGLRKRAVLECHYFQMARSHGNARLGAAQRESFCTAQVGSNGC